MSWDDSGWSSAPSSSNSGWSSDVTPADGQEFGSGAPHTAQPTTSTASAPLVVVVLALAAVAVGVALALATDSLAVSGVGWLFSGPIAITLVGTYLHIDTQRRSAPLYADAGVGPLLVRVTVVAALAGVVLNAYPIADTVARGGS